jgi:hypothetical protein
MGTDATLGGATILASSPARWSFTEGLQPHEETFDLIPADAEKLAKSGASVTLHYKVGDKPVDVKNLTVLRVMPGEHGKISRVLVTDCRWKWPYAWVAGRYNMRMRTGVKRVVALDIPGEVKDVIADVQYAPWSLKVPDGGFAGRWMPLDVLKDVMTQVIGDQPGWQVDPDFAQGLQNLSVEELEVCDAGDNAIGKVLGFFPGAGVTVRGDGLIWFFNRTSGAEVAMAAKLGPEIVGGGHVMLVNNAITRPSIVRVHFVREQEVRFDAIENASISNTSAAIVNQRRLENVLPIPDYSLVVGGKTLCQGTYVTIDAYLNAINGLAGLPGGVRLDHDFLQKAFMPYLDLWGSINLLGIRDAQSDWPARVAALSQHYRRTYRINPRWRARFLKFFANRVATLDPTTFTRSPSLVYGDYAYLGGQRYWWKQLGENPGTEAADLSYAVNKTGYPTGAANGDGTNQFDSHTSPIPAKVFIADHDQGIIHVEHQIDPVKLFDAILPSKLDTIGLPCGDLSQRTRPIAFNAVIKGAENVVPKLASSHKMAIVLTAIPACPNGLGQFFPVEVAPGQVAKLLPSALQSGLSSAFGPIMNVFVGAGTETARGAWMDARATDIEAIFGLPAGAAPPKGDDLIVNSSIGDNSGAASLQSIALGVAARIYALYSDHLEGAATGLMNGDLTVAGWLSRVTHELDTEGKATTKLEFPGQLPKLDLFAFLDSATRAIIMRQVKG